MRKLLLCLLAALAACTTDAVNVSVVDEAAAPVAGAEISFAGTTVVTGDDGTAQVPLLRPGLAMVRAVGFLDEPLPLSLQATGEGVEVRLLDSDRRLVVHSSGDSMLGRRYETPTSGDPLVDATDGGVSAAAVVADIAEGFAAADLVTTNLETVVGELPDKDAYPGKRWLLQTPPAALAAFTSMGVDAVGLANNHQRDWLEAGIESTLNALDEVNLPHVGSGRDADEAGEPVFMERQGVNIALLAFTSVNGDYVNDQYPTDDEEAPGKLAAADQFKWEFRTWGAEQYGIPTAARRIGGAWAAVAAIIDDLPEDDQATLWTSVSATWPELQDWVARRGHGGGHLWTDNAPAEIAATRIEADLVIVQLHMGYQFSAAPSTTVVSAAHDAIDAGADLVICHHPHVLQGFESYKGHIIAYSLGNFLFDQDFLSTFRSGWLRTVWEGNTLVEARIIPTMLDGYRPVAVVDRLATDVGRGLWEASLLEATASRGDDRGVRTVAAETGRAPLGMVEEHGTFLLTDALPAVQQTTFTVSPDEDTPVDLPGLVQRRVNDTPPAGLWVGRSLIGYGQFKDEDGDEWVAETQGWTWTSGDIDIDTARPIAGRQSLTLYRDASNGAAVSARMVARIPLPEHRLYADADGVQPLDGDARHSIHITTRYDGVAPSLTIRAALYHFDDLNPTEDPESIMLHDLELPVPIQGGKTQTIRMDLDPADFEPVGGLSANAVLLYVVLVPPAAGETRVWVDDLDFIEWRSASEEPEGWAAIDWLRTEGSQTTVDLDWIAW